MNFEAFFADALYAAVRVNAKWSATEYDERKAKRTKMNNYTTDFDKLLSDLDSRPVNPDELVSKNADEATKQLFSYLKSIYGKHILSGQQYLQKEELEDDVYFNVTGKLPAVRGYDLMDMDKKKGDDQINRAIKWAKDTGCIITLCWHWYAPDDMDNMDDCTWSFYYKTTSYDHKTSFDILRAVVAGTKEYDFVVSRIDKAAEILRRFENENIPVLFRPLHEANGAWFWWGRREDNPEESIAAYKKLWYMIFDRFENFHKLSNIIWVWNGQARDMAVHPNTFDICGEDIYSELPDDHSAQKPRFDDVTSYTSGKMAALSECGFIPEPDELVREKVSWLWWLPWWGSFVYAVDGWKPIFDKKNQPFCNQKYMNEVFLTRAFNNPYCITLDKLPFYKGNSGLPEKFRKY